MKRFKIFFLNSLLIVITSIILQIMRLFFNIYISNRISSEALGVFQLIMVIYYFGITLASSGINIACIRIISEEYALGDYFGIKKVSKTCIKIALIISLFISFVFFINADFIIKTFLHYKIEKKIIMLICCALPLISVSSAITGYFMGVRRIYKTIIGDFLEQVSKITTVIILFNFNKNNFTIENICYFLLLADLISEIIAFTFDFTVYIFDIKKYYSNLNHCSKEKYIYRICRILFPVSVTTCIKSAISTFKQLITPLSLGKYGNSYSNALSTYGIISGMVMPIVLFPCSFLIAFSSLLIPEFSRYFIKKDYKKIKLYTDKLLIFSFTFSLILSVSFFIFANFLGQIIYHSKNIGIYIKLFSMLIPFIYVDIIIDNILKGLDAQTKVMIINIIDLLISTIFIFFFVPKFGIKGYIGSIFISEILNLLLSLNQLLKIQKKY